MTEPKYSDEEMRAILRDAAERSTDDDARHSLADIERIASEVGIPAALVRDAAASLPARDPVAPHEIRTAPTSVQLVRHVDRAASEAEILEALSLIRQRLGVTGQTRQVGRAVEWFYDSGYSGATISVLPDGERTVVRVDARADGRQFVLYFGAGAAALFAGFVMMAGHASPSAAVITAVGTAIPAFVVARAWFNRSARAMSAKLGALADELARRLSDGRR